MQTATEVEMEMLEEHGAPEPAEEEQEAVPQSKS